MSRYFSDPQNLRQTQRRWGLIVGVNHYEDATIADLRYSINDAHSLYALLISRPDCYERDRLRLLTAQVTRRDILKSLHEQAAAAATGDLLLFYFAGHGHVIDGESYLLSSNTVSTRMLPDTAIPLRRVKEIMQRSSARAKIIILDACHLGVGLNSRAAVTERQAFFSSLFEQAEGIAILAASTRDEASWEDTEKGHGIFTYYLLRGLAGEAHAQRSGYITLDDLVPYLREQISVWGRQQRIRQRPTLDFQGTGEWVLISTHELPEPVVVVPSEPGPPPQQASDFWEFGLNLPSIERRLSSGARKVILIKGGPAAGKTVLLRYFKQLLSTSPHYRATHRYHAIEPHSMASLATFAKEIWEGVRGCFGHAVASSDGSAGTLFENFGSFANLLNQALACCAGMLFIIFIDELDKVYYHYGEVEANRILGLIRYLVEDTDIQIFFFVSMVHDLPRSYGSRFPAEQFTLGPVEPPDFAELAERLLRSRGTLDAPGLVWLYRYTGGYRFALRLIFDQLDDLLPVAPPDTPTLFVALQTAGRYAQTSFRATDVMTQIYNTDLNPDERAIVLWLAGTNTGQLSEQVIAEAGAHMRRACRDLVQRGYLAQLDDDHLCLRIGLMHTWLREWSLFEEERERLHLHLPIHPVSPMGLQTQPTPSSAIPQAGVCIVRSTQRIYVDGQEISETLPDLDYKALTLLAERAGAVVLREEFAQHVWGVKYYEQDDGRISALIYRLRVALGESQKLPRYLLTLRKRGFRLEHAIIVEDEQHNSSRGSDRL